MNSILGKKLEMTQVFRDDGTVVPVTLVEAGPCVVTAVKKCNGGKTTAILGFGSKKGIAKAQREDWKDLGAFAITREFPLSEEEKIERGDKVFVTIFKPGDIVDVIGTSKGKGFQGVVRRHGFHGSPASHGHKDQLRMPGSIGSQGPQRVFQGTKMAGRMGGDRITVKNLEIVEVYPESNTIAIRGAVPGARGGFVTLRATQGNVWHK